MSALILLEPLLVRIAGEFLWLPSDATDSETSDVRPAILPMQRDPRQCHSERGKPSSNRNESFGDTTAGCMSRPAAALVCAFGDCRGRFPTTGESCGRRVRQRVVSSSNRTAESNVFADLALDSGAKRPELAGR